MEWYYGLNNQQHGPVSTEELENLVRNGTIPGTALVWREGMADWQPANTVLDLSGSDTAAAPGTAPASTEPSGRSPYSVIPGENPATQPPGTIGGQPVLHGSGQPLAPGTVPTYLWQSICCLIFCCLPLAIPAIVFATKVNPALMMGDLAEAQRCSNEAKKWCWISFGVGLAGTIVYFLIGVAGGLSEM